MTSVDFVLDALNSELTMAVSAYLPSGEPPAVLDVSATAVYYVPVQAMRDAFSFQSDSRDIDDQDADDTKYFVNWPAAYVLNPSHAYVVDNEIATTDASGSIPSNCLLVKHDFIRHIADDLFNTHLAVDLFDNEQDLKDDLASKGHDLWLNNIKPTIDAVSAGGNLVVADHDYTTNALNNNTNLCRVLLRQLLNVNPSRLNDLNSLAIGDDKFYLPFEAGDSIQFKVVYKAALGQESIIDGRTDPVPDRSYAIKILIVAPADVANVTVFDAGVLNSSAVVVA